MEQDWLFEAVPVEKFDLLTREELIEFVKLEQSFRMKLEKEVNRLRNLHDELRQRTLFVEEKYITIKNKFFGRSSEKSEVEANQKEESPKAKGTKSKKVKVQLPSQRYPQADLIERHIELEKLPQCKVCETEMEDSGMTEDAEFLTVVPEQYLVIRQKRHKYRCACCQGDVVTAPAPPSIKAGSSYSDEMKLDVALSKYCDLIPIERYTSIAKRAGIPGLPPQSLIECTHQVADFVEGVYEKIKEEVLSSSVLAADETPHRMLEGDEKKGWYLWGFSNEKANYFDIQDTRSGDVASSILADSECKVLLSDKYSGYDRAVKEVNKAREDQGLPKIQSAYCNAHSRRKFKEAEVFGEDALYFIECYKNLYHIESSLQEKPPNQRKGLRQKEMKPIFKDMKIKAQELYPDYPHKSAMGKAIGYFLKNYEGLTLFLKNPDIPIDNNRQERLLRNPVIGRKTWYGTHSKRGARTAAILFSLVESCKLNGINPRQYFKDLVQELHAGRQAKTPHQYAKNIIVTDKIIQRAA